MAGGMYEEQRLNTINERHQSNGGGEGRSQRLTLNTSRCRDSLVANLCTPHRNNEWNREHCHLVLGNHKHQPHR